MKIIGLRLGGKGAHPVHESWFSEAGVEKSFPFAFFRSKKMVGAGVLNQFIGLLYSIFIPRADVYFLTGIGCAITAVPKKILFGSKIITINSDTFFTDLGKATGLKKAYMLWLLKYIDGMISTSHLMRKKAKRFIRVPHEVVYPFCDVKRFGKVKPDYKGSNLCSVATARYSKGADILRDVFLLYRKRFPKSQLFVLGSGDASGILRKEKGIFNPDYADPRKYFAKSSIYINTARIEPFGVNIIEAMCAGLPPVVSKECGAAEIVRKVDPGLVTSLDPKEIARKTIALQKNLKKKRALGKKARAVGREYSKDKSMKSFRQAFENFFK